MVDLVQTPSLSVDEFDAFALLPENSGRLFEFIGGEIHEVVSSPESSLIAFRIGGFIFVYLSANDIGQATGSDGGYRIGKERYIPDIAFISYARMPKVQSEAGYVPVPPELAVEVLSPNNTSDEVRVKVSGYLSVGTVVWVVNPHKQVVEVHMPGQPALVLKSGDTLDGGDILPGFTLAVDAIFKKGTASS